MAPMVHGLEATYYGQIKFVYLDAADKATTDFRRELGYVSQPEFYLLDADGNILMRWFGGRIKKSEFEEVFAQYLE